MNRTFFAFKCGVIWICGGDFVYLRTNKGYIVCDGEGTMLVIDTQYMMGYTLLPYYYISLKPPVHTYLILTPLLHITLLILDTIILLPTPHIPYAYISHKYHARWCPYSVYI